MWHYEWKTQAKQNETFPSKIVNLFICKNRPAPESVTNMGEVFLSLKQLRASLYFPSCFYWNKGRIAFTKFKAYKYSSDQFLRTLLFSVFYHFDFNTHKRKLSFLPTGVYIYYHNSSWDWDWGQIGIKLRTKHVIYQKLANFVQQILCKQV